MVINKPGARRNSSLPGSKEEDTLWGSPEKERRLDTDCRYQNKSPGPTGHAQATLGQALTSAA